MHACWLIIDVEDKQLFDFNYILLNNIFCNNDYLCKWKVDVTAECRICKDIKTYKHLIYELKNILQIWRILIRWISFFINIIVGFYFENNRESATLNL